MAADSGPALPGSIELARRVVAAGARAYAIGGGPGLAAVSSLAVPGPQLPEWLAPLGLIVPGQLLTEALSRRLGIDPDSPRGLSKSPRLHERRGPATLPGRVFDLDGTLVDSETRSHESWRHVLTSRGIVPDDSLIRAFVGRRASTFTTC